MEVQGSARSYPVLWRYTQRWIYWATQGGDVIKGSLAEGGHVHGSRATYPESVGKCPGHAPGASLFKQLVEAPPSFPSLCLFIRVIAQHHNHLPSQHLKSQVDLKSQIGKFLYPGGQSGGRG